MTTQTSLPPTSPSSNCLGRFQILAVDDDPATRGLLDQHLTSAGFNVITAPDGDAALDIVRNQRVSLILLDIFLAEKDGIETLMEVRRHCSHLPVIIMSGHREYRGTDLLRFSMKLGAAGTLEKPFTVAELLSAVASTLAQTKQAFDR